MVQGEHYTRVYLDLTSDLCHADNPGQRPQREPVEEQESSDQHTVDMEYIGRIGGICIYSGECNLCNIALYSLYVV